MEFKGTKGKWSVKRFKMTFPSATKWQIINKNEDSLFEVQLAESDEAMEANALLISKAPEMLEMLIELESKLGDFFHKEKEEIKQLIKEATELK